MPTRQTLYNIGISLRAAATLRRRVKENDHAGPVDIFLCVVDHYEPQVGKPPTELARERVLDWVDRYPKVAGKHRDWDGRVPTHSFFYPWDEYDEWEMEHIALLCKDGWGEVEIHLHHRDDSDETLRRKFRDAVSAYRSHGTLSVWPDGRPAWGFIHGNWALDNSRHDHGRNYCGVNNEITVLLEEGCYADFTFPAWQVSAQPRMTNCIYYAADDPAKPKSYDRGVLARSGAIRKDELLLVQGPLVPFIRRSGGKPRPGMDDGDLASSRRYSRDRLHRWINARITVSGRPDRVFVKLFCHGAADGNREALLGTDFDALYTDVESLYNDGEKFRLHYVTAREMFNVIRATELGVEDMIRAFDWVIPPPVAGKRPGVVQPGESTLAARA